MVLRVQSHILAAGSSTQVGLFSKVVKVALISLAVLALAVGSYALIALKMSRTYIPIQAPPEYHPLLIEVLGGLEAFGSIPILKVEDKNLLFVQEGLNPYLQIEAKEMTDSIMKGTDSQGRLFLAFKYKKKSQGTISVDVFLCRDPKYNRWYVNQERSPELFSRERGTTLHFLQLLVQKNHPNFELA